LFAARSTRNWIASGLKPVKVDGAVATAMAGEPPRSESLDSTLDRLPAGLRPVTRRFQASGAPNTSAAFRPPKPKDVDRIRLYSPRRGSHSRPGSNAPISASGSTRLTDGGTQPSRNASAQIAASMAPDAPSGWPYSAFVPLTGTSDATPAPSARAIARASAI